MQKITRSNSKPIIVSVSLMVAAALVLVDPAVAQDWSFEPEIRLGGELDDNATLTIRTDEEIELEGYLLEAIASIKYDSPKTEFRFVPRVLSRNYPDEPEFESDDYFLRSSYEYQGTNSRVGFRLNFDSQAIRTAERIDSDLDIEEPGEIPDNESGRTFASGKRDNWWFLPYWEYQISETSSFGISAVLNDATYNDQLVPFLDDYTDRRLNLGYRHGVTEATSLVYRATGRKYKAAGADSEIEGYGFTAGVDTSFSPTLRFSAEIGVEGANTATSDTDPEVVGSLTLSRNQKTINVWAKYSRSIDASGARSLSIRDSISLNFRRRLTERIAAGLGARAYKSRGYGGQSTIDDRNYVQLHATIAWFMTPTLTFDAEYRYSVLDRQDALGESSNANRVNVWFTWSPMSRPSF